MKKNTLIPIPLKSVKLKLIYKINVKEHMNHEGLKGGNETLSGGPIKKYVKLFVFSMWTQISCGFPNIIFITETDFTYIVYHIYNFVFLFS